MVTVISGGLKAQSQTSRMTEEEKEEAKARYEAYQEKLNLTEAQSAEVEEINLTFFEELSELKKSNEARFAKYKKLKSLGKERDKEMEAVLDDSQYKIYQEYQAEIRDEFKQNRKGRNG